MDVLLQAKLDLAWAPGLVVNPWLKRAVHSQDREPAFYPAARLASCPLCLQAALPEIDVE